jgi:hypothetical protein
VVERQIARAHEIAGARLEIAALEIPGHTDLLLRRNEPRRFSAHERTVSNSPKWGEIRRVSTTSGVQGTRFDYSSAINNASGTFLRDFVFTVGTGP